MVLPSVFVLSHPTFVIVAYGSPTADPVILTVLVDRAAKRKVEEEASICDCEDKGPDSIKY